MRWLWLGASGVICSKAVGAYMERAAVAAETQALVSALGTLRAPHAAVSELRATLSGIIPVTGRPRTNLYVDYVCETCGATFMSNYNWRRRGRSKPRFCSRACFDGFGAPWIQGKGQRFGSGTKP